MDARRRHRRDAHLQGGLRAGHHLGLRRRRSGTGAGGDRAPGVPAQLGRLLGPQQHRQLRRLHDDARQVAIQRKPRCMTTPPRTGLRRLWYVASWRVRYWWLDTRAGLVAQLLVSLAFVVVGCWSAWRGYTTVVDFRGGEIPTNHAIANWVVYAIMFVVSIIVSLALAPSIKGSPAQKGQVPVVEDGAVIRRIYGPVWIKDPVMLAFKPTGTVAIRKKAGKSWKLKTKWQTVGYHYEYIFQFGLCRGMLDSVLAIRAGDKEVWSGQLTSSGIVSVNKPNLWGGEDAEGGIVGDFEFAFGNPDQAPSSYLAANVAPQQSAYRWRPYVTFRGGRWGNSPYPKAPAFLVSRIFNGW